MVALSDWTIHLLFGTVWEGHYIGQIEQTQVHPPVLPGLQKWWRLEDSNPYGVLPHPTRFQGERVCHCTKPPYVVGQAAGVGHLTNPPPFHLRAYPAITSLAVSVRR